MSHKMKLYYNDILCFMALFGFLIYFSHKNLRIAVFILKVRVLKQSVKSTLSNIRSSFIGGQISNLEVQIFNFFTAPCYLPSNSW